MPEHPSDRYVISTDPDRLDIAYIHAYLSQQSYWAANRPYEVVEHSIQNSLCFGLYDTTTGQQVGFARMVTDHATFGYLADVFIDPAQQGNGLGKMLGPAIVEIVAVHGGDDDVVEAELLHGIGDRRAALHHVVWVLQLRAEAPDVVLGTQQTHLLLHAGASTSAALVQVALKLLVYGLVSFPNRELVRVARDRTDLLEGARPLLEPTRDVQAGGARGLAGAPLQRLALVRLFEHLLRAIHELLPQGEALGHVGDRLEALEQCAVDAAILLVISFEVGKARRAAIRLGDARRRQAAVVEQGVAGPTLGEARVRAREGGGDGATGEGRARLEASARRSESDALGAR